MAVNLLEQMLNRYPLVSVEQHDQALREVMQEVALAGLNRAGFVRSRSSLRWIPCHRWVSLRKKSCCSSRFPFTSSALPCPIFLPESYTHCCSVNGRTESRGATGSILSGMYVIRSHPIWHISPDGLMKAVLFAKKLCQKLSYKHYYTSASGR